MQPFITWMFYDFEERLIASASKRKAYDDLYMKSLKNQYQETMRNWNDSFWEFVKFSVSRQLFRKPTSCMKRPTTRFVVYWELGFWELSHKRCPMNLLYLHIRVLGYCDDSFKSNYLCSAQVVVTSILVMFYLKLTFSKDCIFFAIIIT